MKFLINLHSSRLVGSRNNVKNINITHVCFHIFVFYFSVFSLCTVLVILVMTMM
jgi:hypothetical protein